VTSAPTDRPLISTVIPCHNGARYLGAAIESVLAQSYRPLEIIVVDDGSTDDTPAVAATFAAAIRYCRRSHGGAARARNHGVELAAGSFLAFLDADDLWAADKLRRQMAAFDADPSLDIVCGHARQFVSPELPEAVKARVRFAAGTMPAQLPGALLTRREVFDRVGVYSARFVTGTEIDWFMRATELGVRMLMLPDVVLMRRIHTTNHGILRRDASHDYVRVLKSALDRRRQRAVGAGGEEL
jgi:glycosyltransferase involved in cell wall biosynthesis